MSRFRFSLLAAGLFVLVFVISVLYYLPAKSVVAELEAAGVIPEQVELNQVQGAWWNGEANLTVQAAGRNEVLPLGKLHWQWQPLALLSLDVAVAIQLDQQQGGLRAQVEQSLFDFERLSVTSLSTQQNLSWWQSWVPEMALLGKVEGTIQISELAFDWNYAQQWPEHTYGQVTMNQLKLLGDSAGIIVLDLKQPDEKLVCSVSGGPEAWSLSGEVTVQSDTFESDIKLQASAGQALPDWSELFMQRVSTNQANWQYKGTWK